KRQVGSESNLDVRSAASREILPIVERITAIAIAGQRRRSGDVRQQLEATNGFEALDAVQLPEARRPCLLRTRHRNPIVILVIGGDEPLDVQPPYLLVTRVEPELRERNPHFGG